MLHRSAGGLYEGTSGPSPQVSPAVISPPLCHSERADTMGTYHLSKPQGKFKAQNAQTDVEDPWHPAFQD